MGRFLVIIIITVVIVLCWPRIMRWIQGFMARRAEDMVRRMAGMPSRGEEKRAEKRNAEKKRKQRKAEESEREHKQAMSNMRTVAEDVEYTEVREFESRTTYTESADGKRVVVEEQVSDAEYTEIKINS